MKEEWVRKKDVAAMIHSCCYTPGQEVILGTILKKMPSLIIEDDQNIVNYKNFNKGGK